MIPKIVPSLPLNNLFRFMDADLGGWIHYERSQLSIAGQTILLLSIVTPYVKIRHVLLARFKVLRTTETPAESQYILRRLQAAGVVAVMKSLNLGMV